MIIFEGFFIVKHFGDKICPIVSLSIFAIKRVNKYSHSTSYTETYHNAYLKFIISSFTSLWPFKLRKIVRKFKIEM